MSPFRVKGVQVYRGPLLSTSCFLFLYFFFIQVFFEKKMYPFKYWWLQNPPFFKNKQKIKHYLINMQGNTGTICSYSAKARPILLYPSLTPSLSSPCFPQFSLLLITRHEGIISIFCRCCLWMKHFISCTSFIPLSLPSSFNLLYLSFSCCCLNGEATVWVIKDVPLQCRTWRSQSWRGSWDGTEKTQGGSKGRKWGL